MCLSHKRGIHIRELCALRFRSQNRGSSLIRNDSAAAICAAIGLRCLYAVRAGCPVMVWDCALQPKGWYIRRGLYTVPEAERGKIRGIVLPASALRFCIVYAVYCYQELCNNGISKCTSSIRIARHYRTTPSLTGHCLSHSVTRLSLPLSALELSPGPRAPASTHSIKLLGATGDSSHHHESARPT